MALIQSRIDPFLEEETNDERQAAYFIKPMSGFGDVIMALGAVNAIRKAQPESQIHLLTLDRYVTFARLCPFVTAVYGEAETFMNAMEECYSADLKVIVCDWTQALFGINRIHQIDAYLKGSGLHAPSSDKEAILSFDPSLEEALLKKVAGLLPVVQGKKIVLHPSRGDANRTWPVESWDQLIELIIRHGHTPILVGDNSAIPFKGVVKPSPRPEMVDLTNRLSFSDLIALCKLADVFVSPDSGPVQVAGTTGIGIVALYTTVPARCRVPFRRGQHMWKAIGLEPECLHKGCFQTLIKEGPGRNGLRAAFRKDHSHPGSQAAARFLGDFCVWEPDSRYACLREIKPQMVWSACESLLVTDFETLAGTIESAQDALMRGMDQEAVPLFLSCLEAFHLPDLELDLAAALIRSGDIPEAFKGLDVAFKRHPSSDVFNLLAMATYLQDDTEEAERLGNLAVEWNPYDQAALANLALFRAHKAFEAGRFLEGLFALEGHFSHRDRVAPAAKARMVAEDTAHILKGFLTIGLSQSCQAVDSFTQAVQLNTGNVLAAYGLAEAHFLAGSADLATRWYQRALEIEPSFQPAVIKLQELDSRRPG